LQAPLLGHTVREAYLFATEKLGVWGPPRYQTVEVPLRPDDLQRMAKSLSQHVSQTGGATWQQLLPGITNRTATLGAASDTPTAHAEWFTRVMNLP